MEETIERVIFFLVGSGFGWILHIFVSTIRETKDEVHEVLEIERHRDEAGLLQHRWAFNISFSLLMVFVFYAAYSSYQNGRNLVQNQQEDFVRVCVAAEDIRNVQRKTVDAVYTLATSFVQKDERDLTEEEKARVNLFIDRSNRFREDAYNAIEPTEECEPYVDDIDVEPPTPPIPNLN